MKNLKLQFVATFFYGYVFQTHEVRISKVFKDKNT